MFLKILALILSFSGFCMPASELSDTAAPIKDASSSFKIPEESILLTKILTEFPSMELPTEFIMCISLSSFETHTLLIKMYPPPPLTLSTVYPCSGVKRDDTT